jgi:hypothetical protein
MIQTMRNQIISIADKYCEAYGINRFDLFQDNNYKGGKKKKVINGVNVSTLRMALGYYITNTFPITISETAKIIGYKDHSTICTNNKKIYFYLKNNDTYFMPYYTILQAIGTLYAPVRYSKYELKLN